MTLIDSIASFGLNLAVAFIIVRLIYYPQGHDKRYIFTFFTFNTIVFLVIGLSDNTDMSLGLGFGLFAIFSILRYRTDAIPIREMTYLFVLIALPLINSILLSSQAYGELAVANLGMIVVLFVLERGWGFHYESRKTVTYERIELIRPERWPELMADLQERTGLKIKRIEIGKLDFIRDSAQIVLYYDDLPLGTPARFVADQHVAAGDDD